mmetsp:Transcript_90044/g.226555  ORF Transcript_90044/g.226555 Transcript_90044/m.226555 type:complete len:232 (+) Transcript_90044:974-1669(+)
MRPMRECARDWRGCSSNSSSCPSTASSRSTKRSVKSCTGVISITSCNIVESPSSATTLGTLQAPAPSELLLALATEKPLTDVPPLAVLRLANDRVVDCFCLEREFNMVAETVSCHIFAAMLCKYCVEAPQLRTLRAAWSLPLWLSTKVPKASTPCAAAWRTDAAEILPEMPRCNPTQYDHPKTGCRRIRMSTSHGTSEPLLVRLTTIVNATRSEGFAAIARISPDAWPATM